MGVVVVGVIVVVVVVATSSNKQEYDGSIQSIRPFLFCKKRKEIIREMFEDDGFLTILT